MAGTPLSRLGYSRKLDADDLSRLPADLRSRMAGDDILDLMELPEGREWWKKNGWPVRCTFDLKEGSRSLRALAAYVEERKARDGGRSHG